MAQYICPYCRKTIVDTELINCPNCKYNLKIFMNDKNRLYEYAKYCLENNDKRSAFVVLRRASALDNDKALYELGIFYLEKNVIVSGPNRSNFSFAEACFLQSAKLNNEVALQWLISNKQKLTSEDAKEFVKKHEKNRENNYLFFNDDDDTSDGYSINSKTIEINKNNRNEVTNEIIKKINNLSAIKDNISINDFSEKIKELRSLIDKFRYDSFDHAAYREYSSILEYYKKRLKENFEVSLMGFKEQYLGKIIYHIQYGKAKVIELKENDVGYIKAICEFEDGIIRVFSFPAAFENKFVSFTPFENDNNLADEQENIQDIKPIDFNISNENKTIEYYEECKNLRNFYDIINDSLEYYENNIKELERYVDCYDRDAQEEYITISQKNQRFEKMIEESKRYLDNPYMFRIKTKDSHETINDVYIGKEYISDQYGKILVYSWYSKFGNKAYDDINTQFIINNEKFQLLLKRKILIERQKIINVSETFNIEKEDSLISKNILADDYLLKVLEIKKSEGKVSDIISSINYYQNEIIRSNPFSNLIMQGCAGSGKTMVLFHRIKFIIGNNLEKDNNILVLTPNSSFNNYIAPLISDLDIKKIKVYSVVDYYILMINYFTNSTLSEILSGKVQILDDSYLDSLIVEEYYSRRFYKSVVDANLVKINTIINNISNLKKENILLIDLIAEIFKSMRDLLPNYIRTPGKIHKCELYALLLICFYSTQKDTSYNGKKHKDHKIIFIDESQDLSFSEYKLLKEINKKSIFNLFGDLDQNINKYGIKKWSEFNRLFKNIDFYEFNKNYRNTSQIVEFVNRECDKNMDNIGFSSYPIKIITLDKLIDEFISDECKRKSIICSDKYYNKLTREFFELKNNIYRIRDIKGLEFDSVYVYDKELSKNKRYIALTRAMLKLTIIN